MRIHLRAYDDVQSTRRKAWSRSRAPGVGATLSVQRGVEALGRVPVARRTNPGLNVHVLRRLQRIQGNAFVRRLLQASADGANSERIQRAEGEKSPVVIVSGPKKIPKLKEDAAEKVIRTTGAKLEKAGSYRFEPVSGYADFVNNAHKRLKANECASKVLIDGHGGSDADSAWMTMGSVTDPNRGWGTTDIGNNGGKLVGADVFKNIRFCTPCEVYLGGCSFAANKPGLKFMQAIANASGCVTKAYATETTTNPKTGFPEPVTGEKRKKPAKP
jgi:hypothetical protein